MPEQIEYKLYTISPFRASSRAVSLGVQFGWASMQGDVELGWLLLKHILIRTYGWLWLCVAQFWASSRRI